MMEALEAARQQGGEIVHGGQRLDRPGFFVEPTLVKATPDMPIVGEETFAPILYVMPYQTLDEAIAIQNAVEQGLTSAIFTNDLREAEDFLSPAGIRLRHRQRQYRHLGCRDRRRLRRRKGHRRRPRGRLRRVESLHAPADLHDQLRPNCRWPRGCGLTFEPAPARSWRRRLTAATDSVDQLRRPGRVDRRQDDRPRHRPRL